MSNSTAAFLGLPEQAHLEFHFVEGKDVKSFRNGFFKITKLAGPPWPNSGGMMNEEVEVALIGGPSLFCVSTNGDQVGLSQLLDRYCEKSGMRRGRLLNEALILSDGRSFELFECVVTHHKPLPKITKEQWEKATASHQAQQVAPADVSASAVLQQKRG